ncbi:glycerol-3-phosphate phosphatase-like isoform X1 [Periplaneta americana]|uniref:glycerol-3-phosphate phosphatase-like isoform X1 n=1 Tax=Periplaneta americana TaxID=6978 RepID=UPI0037E7BFA2
MYKMSQYLRSLSSLNKEEMVNFLSSFDTVLTDGDGVLWYWQTSMKDSINVINRFKELGKKVFLVSNNCVNTVDQYVMKCEAAGLNLTRDEIIIPSIVAASHLKDQNFSKKAYVLATPAFKEMLKADGIVCSDDVGPDYEVQIGNVQEEIMKMDRDVGAVVIDFDNNINYIKMTKALFHLKRPNCLFVAGAKDLVVPIHKDLNLIGPGHFVSNLEQLSGRKAVITGKPSTLIKDFISKRHPINPERTLMIGDLLSSDIKLGTNCGFQTLLVLSGASTLEEAKNDSTNLPHYYINSLGDLLPLLPSV